MKTFSASLLREKFTIHDAMPSDTAGRKPVIALSNRLNLPLLTHDEKHSEDFIIRAQNMHTCARFSAQIARDFYDNGPILDRKKPFDWKYAYLAITKGYEKKWNPDRWVAVYHKGRLIYEDGAAHRHPFLDIIEQCDARNKSDYGKSVKVAEDAFKQAGKMVTIEHDSNIALIMNVTKEEGKCGLILRGPDHTTTFNLTAKKKADRSVHPSQCLTVAAAFLEGVQLAFLVGMAKQKLKYDLIAPGSDDARKAREAGEKLGRLNGAISQFENLFDVIYRPERPNFALMTDEAEEFARKVLAADIEKKIAAGGKSEWIT